jgi:magnesium-transporting ATPase (P-type)
VTATLAAGLSEEEVAHCVAEGKSNDIPARAARSVSEILQANVFTRINAILGVLLIIVPTTGSVINGLFGILIVANSAIGIIQELRAKRTLDELAIVGQAKPMVRRQSGTTARPPNEVVLGDVIELGPGDQIVVDGDLLEEDNLEVDESLLTGEADPIDKDVGDEVKSGSFVVAGSGAYRATKVGREAYAAKLVEEASKFRSDLTGGRTGRADRCARATGAVAGLVRPCGRRTGRAGRNHPRRAGGARAARPPRRAGNVGLFRFPEGHREGDLGRQCGIRRSGREHAWLHGETMDARKLPAEPGELADALEEYTTFGGVRPDQKRAMVHACSPAATRSR